MFRYNEQISFSVDIIKSIVEKFDLYWTPTYNQQFL